jgi:hypothetical protein
MSANSVYDDLQSNDQCIGINPAQFNDPVALNTKWSPLAKGGASFVTYTLQQGDSDCLEFKSTSTLIFLPWFGIIFGISLILFLSPFSLVSCGGGILSCTVVIIIGASFIIAGVFMRKFFKKRIVFDTRNEIFWKGNSPNEMVLGDERPLVIKIEDIHALQIISEYCEDKYSRARDSSPSFYSYELNVVLNNGSRENVIDHAYYKQVLNDAATLAEYLKKPLWDGALELY